MYIHIICVCIYIYTYLVVFILIFISIYIYIDFSFIISMLILVLILILGFSKYYWTSPQIHTRIDVGDVADFHLDESWLLNSVRTFSGAIERSVFLIQSVLQCSIIQGLPAIVHSIDLCCIGDKYFERCFLLHRSKRNQKPLQQCFEYIRVGKKTGVALFLHSDSGIKVS